MPNIQYLGSYLLMQVIKPIKESYKITGKCLQAM